MAYAGGAAAAEAAHTSSYRVKFRRDEFLRLIHIAEPNIIYRSHRIHFFAYDGFVMYCFDCEDEDFRVPVLHAIEFSNTTWSE
ncbi:MAG: hypothetical protein ACFFED_12320 [Candidatus Thorarchaeota archaeon]